MSVHAHGLGHLAFQGVVVSFASLLAWFWLLACRVAGDAEDWIAAT